MKPIYFVILAGAICLSSGCESESSFAPTDVNATYAGEALSLKYTGEKLTGKNVTVATEEGKTATLTLGNIVPGKPEFVLSKISLTPAPGGKAYTFATDKAEDGYTVTVNGKLQPGKLEMDVQAAVPTNDLTGVWTLAPYRYEHNEIVSTPISIDIVTSDGATGQTISKIGTQLVGKLLSGLLQRIVFDTDGNIVVRYAVTQDGNPEPSCVESPLNLAAYYIRNHKLYLLLNIDMIMQQVGSAPTKANDEVVITLEEIKKALAVLQTWGVEGIPLNYALENGKASIRIDQTLLEPFFPFVQALKYIPQTAAFAGLIEQMTALNISLHLIKSPEE